MSANNCLNCETPLQGSYCYKCGQKSSTHRITFAEFIKHDLVHGVFHVDKGILYTLRTLLFTPGYAAKSFIQGKRVMHYNIFALFIIIIALKTLVDLQAIPGEGAVFESSEPKQTDKLLNENINHNYKFYYLLSIPLLSACSFLFFRRLRYNFTEHIVFNCFLMAGSFFYALLLSVFMYLTGFDTRFLSLLVMCAYAMLTYYQATRGVYSFFAYLWRSLLLIFLFTLLLVLVLTAIIFIFYDGYFEGSLHI